MSDFKFDFDETKYTNFRRELHRIPELAFQELETEKYLKAYFSKLNNFKDNMIVESGLSTGFWINVKGLGSPSKADPLCIALRTDIDGLPIQEENSFDYKSTHDGKAHACGHDGHMTIMTATLELVLSKINEIPSNCSVRFLFQPAEEAGTGAKAMIKANCLDKVDEIYAIHNFPIFNLGSIALKEGSLMASGNAFEVEITGLGGHGSIPSLCHSPITTGSEIVNKLNQITSQRIDSVNRSIVSVGSFKSGATGNVIPEKATISGSFRTFSDDVDNEIEEEITNICTSISELNYSTCTIKFTKVCLATINDSSLVDHIKNSMIGSSIIITTQGLPVTASEDFSYYQKEVKGAMALLGSGDDKHSISLHSPNYDFNDFSTKFGVELYLRIIENRFNIHIFK